MTARLKIYIFQDFIFMYALTSEGNRDTFGKYSRNTFGGGSKICAIMFHTRQFRKQILWKLDLILTV